MSRYSEVISSINPNINPIGVECSMRLQFSTLDHLSRAEFRRETKLAAQCEAAEPGYLRAVSESYGMGKDFSAWESARK